MKAPQPGRSHSAVKAVLAVRLIGQPGCGHEFKQRRAIMWGAPLPEMRRDGETLQAPRRPD